MDNGILQYIRQQQELERAQLPLYDDYLEPESELNFEIDFGVTESNGYFCY